MNSQDEKRIAELQAQIDKIQNESARRDMLDAISRKLSDEDLYPFVKSFTNHVERQRRGKILQKARDEKASKQAIPAV